MTTVGKILVFVCLLMSLVICAFAVMDYSTRFPWPTAYKQQETARKASDANASQYYQEMLKARADQDAAAAAAEARIKEARAEAEGLRTQLAAMGRKVADAEARAAQNETVAKAGQVDVARRQADVEKIRDTLASEITRNTQLVKDANTMRDRAVAAEIQVKSLKDIMARMENQLQETAKDLARIKQSVGSGSRAALASGSNPPPENVEGMVRAADSSGLLKLSIGSDSGIAKGHTLELYRLASVPSQSKYLGRVRVLDVTPHESVAQPLGRLSDKPQPGDRVASRLGND